MKAHLTIVYEPWAGARRVPLDESLILFIHHVEVNGLFLWHGAVSLDTDGFMSIAISPGGGGLAHGSYEKLREMFDPSVWLEDTTDELLVLPVARLDVRELEEGSPR
jgi:hypothetical protein